ncbi:T9SS sorting signal type C domain-containing protein [Flavobacterium branchiarum]|uniref:T9SS sorting signal type C domain-containing protein n=1 Tax=Flavobacterium branchiarum TaxID=1114870 RepID=A0ABV5FKS2_9FLAO|nr:T9SS sorting signal type C domain-containing protein [Flavobacterium branchiarum]MDN3675234.1 T9SS sorting signal type C domain-containing protein [Flavobacterium branchiarum]
MRLKLSFFFIFTCIYSWSQTTNTFSTSGSFTVPAGLTLLTAECWGAGGSGSGTSTSTSAGGGGGGGYSVASISVTPNSSISYVVGTGTLGANGIGVSGTASSFSTVSANGGAGGGNSGAGGLGGVGTTFSGGKGSNGSLVLGLIFSGGGGGSAGTAIKGNDGNNGSGGLAVAGGGGGGNGATLAGAGSTGIVPGGGGGGGLVLLGIGTNKGGNGANGEIKITYTCPSYSFTGISASNICTSVGSTSTITLNSSAASLPVGNYVVTYNTNNPNATGLTANMVVNGAGMGTFTATGLVTAGSSTITITKITSGTCSSTIISNNTVVVTVSLPSVGGTVSGGTTICSGSPSGLLTLGGHTGSVVKWQYAISPFSSWIDIANTTNATYTSGGLTATTEFRAIVQSGTCVTATSAVTTVTVNPLPTISASSSATNVCFSASTQNTSLSYSAIGEIPTTYSIVWNASPSNSFVAINNVVLPASPIPIAVPANTSGGTYTGTLTVKNANGCISSGTPFTVTVNPLPTITASASTANVCLSASSQNTSLSYSATTGTPTTYSIVWNASPTNSFVAVTNASLPASPITIAVPANTAVGTYTGTLTVTNANGCISSGTPFTVTVNPLPTITASASTANVCFSAGAQNTSLAYSATTGVPTTYSIVWNASPTNSFVAVTNASLPASPITIAVPANTAVGTYTGTLRVTNANGCISSGTPFTVTVNPLPTITASASTANVCFSASVQNTSLSYSATTGIPTTYSIVWNASPSNSFVAVTNASLPASPITIAVPANTAVGTYTGTLRVTNANGCISSGTPFTVTINALPTITTAGVVGQVCSSSSLQNTTIAYTATGGTPTGYSIDWDATANANFLADQLNTSFSFLPTGGNINTIVIPANTVAGTYSGIMTITNGICTNVQAVSVTINSTMPPVIGLVTSLTCDVSYGSVALSGLPSGNWSIVTNPVTVTTTGSGANTVITNLAPNTYTFRVSNSVTGCTSVASATATVGGIVTNYWDGSEWTSNTPTINQNIVFGGNYNSQAGSGGDLNGCTCQVNSGVKVVFNSGATLSIVKAVNVSTAVGTSLTFMNNASLFQKNNVSNSGNVIYKRTSTAMNALDYSYWSSPVSGQKFNLLSPNSDPQKLYSYNSGWISEAPTNTMKIGKGYIIRVPRVGTWPNGEVVTYPYSQPVSFVGTPNNGNITGETITVLDDSYLIGNPYPSAIDAKAFLTANKLILEGTLYFWTHNTPIAYDGAFEKIYTANDYAVYNFTGGTATSAALNPGINNAVPLGLIASGQSFFAYSIASSGTIVFNNDMRVVGNNAQFFRSSKETKETVTKEARLWLNLKNTNGFFKQVLIGYIDGATNEFESKFDGTKFDVEQMADLYSIVSDRKLTIQGRALPFDVNDKVVLGYSSEINDNYTIAIDRSDGLLANQDVYLEDKTLGTIHNLTQTGYTFSTAIGTFDDRFTLFYSNKTLGTAELDTSKKSISVVVENQEIKVNGFDQKIDEVFIYDMSGRLIYKKEKIENSKLIIENLKSSNQILLVKVILDDNRTETKKVIF